MSGASLRRDSALDALRTLAVVLMVASHTTRLIVWDERRDWSRWSLIIEPFTASLFLFLVGASLVASFRHAESAGVTRILWLRRQGLRCLALWTASVAFYTVSEGFLLPDALLLSGILCTIAYTAALVSLLLAGPRPAFSLGLVAAILTGAYAWLDVRETRVFFFNAGNSPFFPLGIFGFYGALGALALRSGNRWVLGALVAVAAATLAYLLSLHPFAELFTKPVGRYETARVFILGEGAARTEKSIPYYNLSLILAPAILSLAVLAYAAFAAARPALDRVASWGLRLGRRSLDVYILHLIVLAIFVTMGGKRPLKAAWQGDAVILGVLALCYAWVLGRDIVAARRSARSA